MKKAICIPTYNRPEAINELILRYGKTFKNLDYDIYIFDSSTTDKTSDIVKEHINNMDHLYYVRINSDVHSNMKVYLIYEEFIKKQEYEYIWVQSDSIRWTENALETITKIVDENIYDYIIPNHRDVEQIGNKQYNNKDLFLRDCSWCMTLYGATIVRIKTVFHDIDWNYLNEKYGKSECINFSHVGLFFEQILRMDGFCAYHMSLSGSLSSTLYKKEPGWRKDTFFVLCECWPNVIKTIPDSYLYKEEAIRKIGNCTNELTVDGLKKLRYDGILDNKTFKKYRSIWKTISDIPVSTFWFYSIVPRKIAQYLSKEYWLFKKIKRKLIVFCKNHSDIYIYGCGSKGARVACFLEEAKIQYKAFVISNHHNDKSSLYNKPVISFDSSILKKDDSGIIIALNKHNYNEVIKQFTSEQLKTNILSLGDYEF